MKPFGYLGPRFISLLVFLGLFRQFLTLPFHFPFVKCNLVGQGYIFKYF